MKEKVDTKLLTERREYERLGKVRLIQFSKEWKSRRVEGYDSLMSDGGGSKD